MSEQQPLLSRQRQQREKKNTKTSATADDAPTIPTWLRWTTNILSLAAVFFFSGVIFGWAPMELMLLSEGQYRSRCHSNSTQECPEQVNALHIMFTLAQFWLSFASLPVGIAVDSCPKSLLWFFCAILEISGLLLMAISDTTTESTSDDDHPAVIMDYFVQGYSLMAIGGCVTMLTAFPATFLLPDYQAAFLASISCLFDASSIVFFGFHQLQGIISRREMFVLYAVWGLVIYCALIVCWYLVERKDWQRILQDEACRGNGQPRDATAVSNTIDDDSIIESSCENRKTILHRSERIQSLTLPNQLLTVDFGLAVLFASAQMLRCNYFIMTVDAFTAWLIRRDDEDVDSSNNQYARLFSWILPCGIVFVPCIEYTITRWGLIKTLHFTNLVGLVFGILLCIPILSPVQVLNFALFTCFRAYLYASLNTFIAQVFGIITMGRILGCVFTTAAVVSLIQYPLAYVAASLSAYLQVNMGLLGLSLLPVAATFGYSAIMAQQQSKDEHSISQSQQTIMSTTASVSPALYLASPGGRNIVGSARNARKIANTS